VSFVNRLIRPGSSRVSPAQTKKPDIGFVACIERGVLEAQALLLFESIRRYAGCFRDCSIYALSPRTGYEISGAARKRLDELGVNHCDRVLNTECTEYGSANRVAAAAHIEATHPHEFLVILDSDTLFIGEPTEMILPADVDAAVRPVDLKGISTSGAGDPFDAYWRALCECSDTDYDEIPWGESFVDRQRIKSNYNGGLVVVRGGLGILRRWSDCFFKSIRQGLRPQAVNPPFLAGAGWVEPPVVKLWGSNQAALSLAIWRSTRRVRELPPTYNYPLHLHHQIAPDLVKSAFPRLVHIHYHWLFGEKELSGNPLFRSDGPLSRAQRGWLRSVTPLT
jgi:hypothetical protein